MNGQIPEPQICRPLKAWGGALIAVAVLVLVGRFAGVRWLVTWGAGNPVMAFPTAMGFLFTGIACLAHGCNRPGTSVSGQYSHGRPAHVREMSRK